MTLPDDPTTPPGGRPRPTGAPQKSSIERLAELREQMAAAKAVERGETTAPARRRPPAPPQAQPAPRPAQPRPAPPPPRAAMAQSAPRAEPQYTETPAFAAFEWMIAGRYLRSRKSGFLTLSTVFSFLGIMLAVATLIVVTAVMTGFRENLVRQVVGVDGHVVVAPQFGPFENYDAVAEAIEEVPGVVSVAPVVSGEVLASAAERYSGALVSGMRGPDIAALTRPGSCASAEKGAGTLDGFDIPPVSGSGPIGIAIGDAMAARFGLCPGGEISLTSPNLNGPITPFSPTPVPRRRTYRVAYIFDTGYHHYDSKYIYMPLRESQFYFNRGDGVDALAVTIDDPERMEARLDAVLRPTQALFPGGLARHTTWRARSGAFVAALDAERVMMFVVLTMIIVVAALNIVSGLVMLVKDKTRNIAILRTMGATRGAVMRVFFICGSSIGVFGTLCGVALGALICMNFGAVQQFVAKHIGVKFDPSVYGLDVLPAVMRWEDVGLACGISLGLSFLATLFPAWRAARLDPVEALRYE